MRDLLREAGGALVARLLTSNELSLLQVEAFRCHSGARTAFRAVPGDGDGRFGDPERWLESASGGPALNGFYEAPRTLALLREMTGSGWTPSGAAGTFSYYRADGHHLGLHRDIDVCQLALITNVYEVGATPGSRAGSLAMYPTRTQEQLSSIRASPERGEHLLRLRPGESLLLLGGLVPHRLLPVGTGHVRIVAPLCYRPAS